MASSSTNGIDPSNVDLTSLDDRQIRDVICYLELSSNDYNGNLGARISALFVILIVSTAVTVFPVAAKRVRWMRIPLYVYLFARYFGAGVIVATAFVHLLDPAYGEIGPNTCVGMTGGWAEYSWVPAIAMTSVFVIFLLDLTAERYVEQKYGLDEEDSNVDQVLARRTSQGRSSGLYAANNVVLDSEAPDAAVEASLRGVRSRQDSVKDLSEITDDPALAEKYRNMETRAFKQQIAAFLILEFGVIFHSVIIGLTLATAGDEFSALYPVIVFHQSFEGLGIGARMSAIPFPKKSWLPWVLCLAYGLTTPIAIAIGLGIRHTYNGNSFTANVVSGVFDSISAGILLYTGLVELLARDFIFDPLRTKDNMRLTFMVGCTLLGAGIMALLGKWA